MNGFPVSSINSLIRPSCNQGRDTILQEMSRIMEVCCRDEQSRTIDIRSFIHWVKPAVLHQQYQLYIDKGAIYPSGYMSWAWVNRKTLERYLNQERFNLSPSEWNEGRNLIIVDFICSGSTHNMLRHILKIKKKIAMVGVVNVYYKHK